jgi:hypothetical protein
LGGRVLTPNAQRLMPDYVWYSALMRT